MGQKRRIAEQLWEACERKDKRAAIQLLDALIIYIEMERYQDEEKQAS